jgi:hypothetical protein
VNSVRSLGATLKLLASISLASVLAGCAATGPIWSPPDQSLSTDAQVIVHRYSQIGGNSGSWVPARVEVNERALGKLPDNSFVAFTLPAGDISVSATDMINLHYDDENRMTLHARVSSGETVYFRIVGVYGAGCDVIYERVDGGVIASRTYNTRRDSANSSCFQQVPADVALKELESIRRRTD